MLRLFLSILFLLPVIVFAQKPEVVVTTGHTEQVNAIAVTADGKTMASGSNDKLVKIWEVATGREIRTLSNNNGRVVTLEFDATGQYIAALLYSDEIKVWNVKTGGLQATFPAPASSESLGFGLNNTRLIFLNENGKVSVANYKDGTVEKNLEVPYPQQMALHPNGEQVFVYSYQGGIHGFDLLGGTEVSNWKVFDTYKFSVTPIQFDPSGKYLAGAFDQDGEQIRLFDVNKKQLIGTFAQHKTRLTTLAFDAKSKTLFSAAFDGQLIAWDLKTQTVRWQNRPGTFALQTIAPHPNGKDFFAAEMKLIHQMRGKDASKTRTFNAVGNGIVNMAYDQIGNFVAIAANDLTIKLWELRQNRVSSVIRGFFPVAFSPGGSTLVSMESAIQLAVWDPYTGKKLQSLSTEAELIQNLTFSPDGRYLAGAGFQGVVRIWDMQTGNIIKRLLGHEGGIYNIAFSPDNQTLATVGLDRTLRTWDWQNEKELQKVEAHEVLSSDVEYSPDGKLIATSGWDKLVKLWDANTLAPIRTLEGHVNTVMSLSFSGDGAQLASSAGNNTVAEADNSIKVWEVATGQELCRLENHLNIVQKVVYDQRANVAISSGNDGFAKIWDVDQCEELASLISVNREDYVLLTPDNYYTASKDALAGVSFRIDDQIYPFDQFDLKLNRPDIVASRIGHSPPALVKAYYKAYQKRLKKMNFTEEMLGDDFQLPFTKILSEDLPITTEKSKLDIAVECWDDKHYLDRINVYVNDVPLFGMEGIDLRKKRTKKIETTIEAALIPGANKIQISVLNENGLESLRETHEVLRETQGVVGDLHLIVVGVSDYKEEAFKLDFAAKDARDVKKLLSGATGLYNEIHVKELTDVDATRENINVLEAYLKQTKVEDVVIMFFAGHGILDQNLEYYFGTYDIGPKTITSRGLPYTEIENLFNKTKALKKLLIMDTCHSGEVDDDTNEKDSDGPGKDRNIKVKTFEKIRGSAGASVGLSNSFELMQTLFSDIRRGTGTTVLSSAAGAELAYESLEWDNGLFTYALLEGISSKKADLNKDGKILVSELRRYVHAEVSRLSDGQQHPTFRNENLTMDYQIW